MISDEKKLMSIKSPVFKNVSSSHFERKPNFKRPFLLLTFFQKKQDTVINMRFFFFTWPNNAKSGISNCE